MDFIDTHIGFIIVIFIFACVFLIVLAIMQHYRLRTQVRQRTLKQTYNDVQSSDSDNLSSNSTLGAEKLMQESGEIIALEKGLSRQKQGTSNTIEDDLRRSGFFSESAPFWYYTITITLTVLMPLIFLQVITVYEIELPTLTLIAIVLSIAIISIIIPRIYLDYCKNKLKEECWRGFPDFMDLMVIAAESGVTPRSAIDRISKELTHTYPYLGANLYYISLELRAGRPLHEAVEGFARRVGINEMRSLGSLLQQSEELGTSLTSTLRVSSEEMRDRRMARAEEKAYSLPVKLIIPITIYVFPVTLLVVLLPMIIKFSDGGLIK